MGDKIFSQLFDKLRIDNYELQTMENGDLLIMCKGNPLYTGYLFFQRLAPMSDARSYRAIFKAPGVMTFTGRDVALIIREKGEAEKNRLIHKGIIDTIDAMIDTLTNMRNELKEGRQP